MARVAILGAGALGTALSIALHKRDRSLTLWTIEPDVCESLRRTHENGKYLAGYLISPTVHVTLEMAEALEDADLAIISVPSSAVREVARQAVGLLPEGCVLASTAKGLEEGSWLRMSEVILQELPDGLQVPVVAMSGSCLATELARSTAAAVDVACEDVTAARRAKQLLATPRFRLHPTADVAGVEAGGTFTCVYAVAAGIGDGLGWGLNERAAFLTKAIGEIARLGGLLGGRRSTMFGLSGLGDLAVTAFSPHSRNRRVGEELAKGRSLREVLASAVSVVEGVGAARAAHAIAGQNHLRLPISEAVHAILHEGAEPKSMLKALVKAR